MAQYIMMLIVFKIMIHAQQSGWNNKKNKIKNNVNKNNNNIIIMKKINETNVNNRRHSGYAKNTDSRRDCQRQYPMVRRWSDIKNIWATNR